MLLITGINHLNCVPYEVLHGLVLENNRFSAVRHRTPDFMRAPAILNYLTPYSVRQLDFILPEVPRYTDSLSLMKSSTSIWDTIALDWTPERCRQRYRKRFGVETSYRLGNKLLGWTTSPNAAYRFLLIGLGFLLLNLWVHLCWLYTQVAHRGRRAFAPSLFRQARFINFLKHALERIYGTVNKIRAPAAPLL